MANFDCAFGRFGRIFGSVILALMALVMLSGQVYAKGSHEANQALLDAVYNGDVDAARKALDQGAAPDSNRV